MISNRRFSAYAFMEDVFRYGLITPVNRAAESIISALIRLSELMILFATLTPSLNGLT